MEIAVHAGITKENGDALKQLYEEYKGLVFPGQGEKKDDFLESAKRALADEAKKVYMVQTGAQAGKDALKRAMNSADPNLQKWAARELQEQEKKKQGLQKRLSRGVPPPRQEKT